jgi:predicted nucleic acid-binding protein
LEIAQQLDHPVYDAVYLAVAEDIRATFVTAEVELWRRASAHGFQTVLLENPLTQESASS